MKKMILILTGILILLASASAQSRLLLSCGANMIRPADTAYRSIYGNQVLYPELGVAIRTVGGLCLTGSYGQFTKNGTTPGLGLDSRAKQSYMAFGLGYLIRLSSSFCLQAGGGVAALKFSEEALDTQIEGQKWGPIGEGGILFLPEEGQGFFLGLKVGFLSAKVSDLASDIAGPQPVNLGGFKVALSVGIQLF